MTAPAQPVGVFGLAGAGDTDVQGEGAACGVAVIANGGTTKLDGDRQVKVFVGGLAGRLTSSSTSPVTASDLRVASSGLICGRGCG